MTINDYLQLGLYVLVLLLLVKPLGAYMALVFADEPNRVHRIGGPVERVLYRLSGVAPDEDMSWKRYALAMLVFNVAGLLFVYLLQRVQQWLPLNPQGFGAVSADSAFNTAISFATNTNWQGYGGESTMSYLTQMLGLAVQNFLSAATGIAVLIALIRGFVRRNADRRRQLLGRPDARDAVHPAAAVADRRARAGLARRAAELQAVRERAAAAGDDADRNRQGRRRQAVKDATARTSPRKRP